VMRFLVRNALVKWYVASSLNSPIGVLSHFGLKVSRSSLFWAAGVKIPDDKIIDIVTYRCPECGFLESYAKK
jgi:hypothetical protein